eukprot:9632188-Alexandrium_andersonii.AAC.1
MCSIERAGSCRLCAHALCSSSAQARALARVPQRTSHVPSAPARVLRARLYAQGVQAHMCCIKCVMCRVRKCMQALARTQCAGTCAASAPRLRQVRRRARSALARAPRAHPACAKRASACALRAPQCTKYAGARCASTHVRHRVHKRQQVRELPKRAHGMCCDVLPRAGESNRNVAECRMKWIPPESGGRRRSSP